MSDELLHELLDDPDDADAYLVYADWLQGRGDPRGELIALQHAAELTGDDRVQGSAQDYFRAHRREFLSDELADAVTYAREHGMRGKAGLELHWRRGFIERAWLGRQPDGELAEARGVLAALLGHPSACLLRELVLDVPIWGRWVDFPALSSVLEDVPVPPPLRRLQIGDFVEGAPGQRRWPDRDISAVELGDLSPLWPRYPRLEELELQGCHARFGALELPALRSFELCSSTTSDDDVAAFASARWPKLQRLVVWFGDGEYGGGVTLPALEALLRVPNPGVIELGVMNTVHSDPVARLLPQLPIARRLRILDLSLGTLSGAGAAALRRDAFPLLEELRVHRSYLSSADLVALRAWCPHLLAEEMRDPEGHRYVSESE